MKKFIAILAILAFLPMTVWAGPKVSRNGGGQPLDADLTTIAGLTVAQGKFIIGSSSPAWSASAYTLPTAVVDSDGEAV